MSSGASSASDLQRFQLPALRSFDDFTARFQLPNFSDLDKWGNRVVKNLLYYQTNYFLIFLCIYGLMLLINPIKILCGLFVQAFLIAVILYAFFDIKSSSSSSSAKNFIASRLTKSSTNMAQQQQHKWYILAGTLLAAYLILYWFEALLLTTFTLLLPVSLTFVHASLRLRNIKNKLVNTMDTFVPTNTPMSGFLDAFNITVDGILN